MGHTLLQAPVQKWMIFGRSFCLITCFPSSGKNTPRHSCQLKKPFSSSKMPLEHLKKKNLSGQTSKQVSKSHCRIFLETEANWQRSYASKLLLPTDHARYQLGMLPVMSFFPNHVWELPEAVVEAKIMLGTVRAV